MNQSLSPVDTPRVEAIVNQLFPAKDTHVERVRSGISTYVYRIHSGGQTYYLRILPDEQASFTPEMAALYQLRQNHINVPEVIYFEKYNDMLGRPIMIEAEIKGLPLSKSSLPRKVRENLALEAGRDLARINSLPAEGFGWLQPDPAEPTRLCAKWPTYRAFALEYRKADLAYLGQHVLGPQESAEIKHVLIRYDSWLDINQGYLVHGDFDATHIFQENGQYTGIIDFGEVRSAWRWYDLAHFRIRDGVFPPHQLFPFIERGYHEMAPLPPMYEQHLRFTSVLINLRALSRAFQSRPPDEYIWRQIAVLREDLAMLS